METITDPFAVLQELIAFYMKYYALTKVQAVASIKKDLKTVAYF